LRDCDVYSYRDLTNRDHAKRLPNNRRQINFGWPWCRAKRNS
jgi:hypothetical protein